ncbi:MAG: hypothetical protein NC131_01395 [Roseburia sp.]|nr:hypothetical protein [Roseburia sp.]
MKKIIGVISLLFIGLTVSLFGCSKSASPEFKKFDSFAKYKNFDEGVVAVDVSWDLGGKADIFTVTDTEQVNEIVGLFSNTIMEKGKGIAIGDNHVVKFVYGDGSKVPVNLLYINEGNDYYFYTNSDVRTTVRRIGRLNNELDTKFTDFGGCKGLNGVSKINVSWFKQDGDLVNLKITDINSISQIKTLFCNSAFKRANKRDVTKSEIEFVYESGETFKLGLEQVWDDGYYFDYTDSSVYDYIAQLVAEI